MLRMFQGFELNIFAILFLIGLYATIAIREYRLNTSNRLFIRMIWLTMLMLLIEMVTQLIDYRPGRSWWYANYIFNFLYVGLSPLAISLWLSYVDYHVFHDYNRLKGRYFYLHPMLLTAVLMLINIFHPIIFTISENNLYTRLPFIWVLLLQAFAAVIYLSYLLYIHRDEVRVELIMTMLAFIMMPSIAATLQVLLNTKSLNWTSMTFVLVITFIFLETVSTSRDYMTGLCSRHMADDYIEYRIQMEMDFWVMSIDLDKFKAINDTYGHSMGDKVLKIFAKVLEDALPSNMLKARYGGDEFIIIADGINEQSPDDYRRRIKGGIIHHCKVNDLPFKFECSVGYQAYEKGMTYQQLMNKVDEDMYARKEEK